MKYGTIKNKPPPAYPQWTDFEAESDTAGCPPTGDVSTSGISVLLCALLMSNGCHSPAASDDTPGRYAPAHPDNRTDAAATEQAKQISAVVAPFLTEAMENDGRGGFGCVAITPSVFLSEEEALDLIYKELSAAGLTLEANRILQNMEAPVKSAEKDGFINGVPGGFSTQDAELELAPRPVRFDFGDTNRGVYIQYVSQSVYGLWNPEKSWSTFSGYDFPSIIEKMAAAYSTYQTNTPVRLGLFFDPFVTLSARHSFPGTLSEEEEKQTWRIIWPHHVQASDYAKERLRLQVQHFIEYLKSEGVLDDVTEEAR